MEGHQVRVRLEDGRRLECELVSSARRGAGTVWLHTDGGDDHFVPVASITDVRQIA
jgi:pentose-5-phosphate-3-epimerase